MTKETNNKLYTVDFVFAKEKRKNRRGKSRKCLEQINSIQFSNT